MPLLAIDSTETQKLLSKIVAKTWLDEEFKERFLSNTNTVLEENGLTLPNGVECKVHENILVATLASTATSTDTTVVYEIPLPSKPTGLTAQPIQSWVDKDAYVSPVGDCKITL